MKKKQTSYAIPLFAGLFSFALLVSPKCDDCGEEKCIYVEIDQRYDQSKCDLLESILLVCEERKIKDLKTIELIKANYNL